MTGEWAGAEKLPALAGDGSLPSPAPAPTGVAVPPSALTLLNRADGLLGEIGRRMHRFSWLREPDASIDECLVVDAYYPGNGLVLLVGEHTPEELALCEREIPAHGLRLLVLTPDEFVDEPGQITTRLHELLREVRRRPRGLPAPRMRISSAPEPGTASPPSPPPAAAPLAAGSTPASPPSASSSGPRPATGPVEPIWRTRPTPGAGPQPGYRPAYQPPAHQPAARQPAAQPAYQPALPPPAYQPAPPSYRSAPPPAGQPAAQPETREPTARETHPLPAYEAPPEARPAPPPPQIPRRVENPLKHAREAAQRITSEKLAHENYTALFRAQADAEARRRRHETNEDQERAGMLLGVVLTGVVFLELFVLMAIISWGGGHTLLGFGFAFDACARAIGTIAYTRASDDEHAWGCLFFGSPAVVSLTVFSDSDDAPEPAPLGGWLGVLAIVLIVIGLIAAFV